jgi:alkylation response protein AidB-like acyl-CoA dehydrogenase
LQKLVPPLLTEKAFATVGISHLTTSRRHLAKPVLQAHVSGDGYLLNGYSPWVTGAAHADTLVIGATLADGRQFTAAIDASGPGVTIRPPEDLVALSASQTGRVDLHDVFVPAEHLLAGPADQVMQSGRSSGTGGLPTSALALGLASRALELLETDSASRADLAPPAQALRSQWQILYDDLLHLASGEPVCTADDVRMRANDLALRASQAALMAAKGAGYMQSHPAGRLCREALFFLVWSCPQGVTATHLCELAGLS